MLIAGLTLAGCQEEKMNVYIGSLLEGETEAQVGMGAGKLPGQSVGEGSQGRIGGWS